MPSSLQSAIEVAVNEVNLPVIDISQFPQEFHGHYLQYHSEVTKLREVCREWGFFRLVNHGIPEDLLQKVQLAGKDLLSMPTEAKDRATDSYPMESYYRKPGVPPPYETFCFLDMKNSDLVEKVSRKIWPEQGDSIFCETIQTYSLSVTALERKITKAILASLGLDVETFYKSDFEKCKPYMRINGYSSHGKSIGEVALISHADGGYLTILYQDDVGGLEIRSKEGNWLSVKPQSNSLVVNLGDSMKAWSNGRYRSAHHRVICKGWMNRMSIGVFYVFPNEREIWAPEELVDEDNPRRYKPFIYSEFKHEVRHNTPNEFKPTAIERFAGI